MFANSLDPDQAPPKVLSYLDPNCFDTLMVILKEFFENFNFKKYISKDDEKLACKKLNVINTKILHRFR